MRKIFTWLILFIGTLHAAEVTLDLSEETVEAGAGAVLTVRIKGGSLDAQPEIPAVKDLVVNARGSGTQMSITNGQFSRTTTYTYVVGSHVPGEYEIPSITLKVDGEEVTTVPRKLTVTPSANAPPAGMAGDDEEPEVSEEDEYGFMTFEHLLTGREHVYPGEIAPVRIRAFFPSGVRIQQLSQLRPEGDSFTLHNLSDQAQQSTEVVKGKRYTVLTWFGGLSATKAGTYPASFSMDLQVAVRDRSANQPPSPFDDPFFGGSMMGGFFAPMIQKEVTLSTGDPVEIEVRELPKEGVPEDFTGAIGSFDFSAIKVPNSLTTGEPCRIEARVEGKGNFALLKAPHPSSPTEWKVYDGNDQFVAGDAASFSGAKVFQYNAVPLVPGEREVKLSFSYFDPDAGSYKSVESSGEKVVISGEAAVPDEIVEAKEPEKQEPEGPELAPLRSELGATGSYLPLSDRGWFFPVIGSCGLCALGLFGYGLWSSRGIDVAKQARLAGDLAVQDALKAADRAVMAGDGVGFFLAAREALRIRVAQRSGVSAEAVTLADLKESADEDVVGILKEADRLDYSGRARSVGDLEAWRKALDRGVVQLNEGGKKA